MDFSVKAKDDRLNSFLFSIFLSIFLFLELELGLE